MKMQAKIFTKTVKVRILGKIEEARIKICEKDILLTFVLFKHIITSIKVNKRRVFLWERLKRLLKWQKRIMA